MNTIKVKMVGILILLFILTGCAGQPAQPTLDPNVIYTAAAQTVQAQLAVSLSGTGTAAAQTAAQPTATQTATPTPPVNLPTVAPAEAQTLNPQTTMVQTTLNIPAPGSNQTLAATNSPLGVITLTPTAALTADTSGDKGEYVDQDPDDGTQIGENIGFNTTFKIKNTGTTTWTTTDYYAAQMNSSDALTEQSWYFIRKDVKPGELASIVTDMHTPSKSGTFVSKWCLLNKANPTKCISIFSVSIVVP